MLNLNVDGSHNHRTDLWRSPKELAWTICQRFLWRDVFIYMRRSHCRRLQPLWMMFLILIFLVLITGLAASLMCFVDILAIMGHSSDFQWMILDIVPAKLHPAIADDARGGFYPKYSS